MLALVCQSQTRNIPGLNEQTFTLPTLSDCIEFSNHQIGRVPPSAQYLWESSIVCINLKGHHDGGPATKMATNVLCVPLNFFHSAIAERRVILLCSTIKQSIPILMTLMETNASPLLKEDLHCTYESEFI